MINITTFPNSNTFWYYYSQNNNTNVDDFFISSKRPLLVKNLDEIKSRGFDNNSLPLVLGQNVPKDPTKFDFIIYFKILKTHLLGQNIIMNLELKNDVYLCLQLLSMTQQGLTILADQQTDINSGNYDTNMQRFVCPIGSLVFSFKLQRVDKNHSSLLEKLLGIAIVEALSTRSVVKQSKTEIKIQYIENSLTHPLYANNQKIGGILTQLSNNDDVFDVSLGAGINVHDSVFSLNNITGGSSTIILVSREEILATFFNNFESMYFTFINKGLEPFKDRLKLISKL
ncbi:hypothetical protein CYY_007304 [Polysphondylium violaceum]|uniref:Uncharacterized protein n=1 Tax=Polysphondylium violaceum TaxID=133409 RepID=A0A8J4PPE5_9MYCE|nr:hypothetical protein CYY_007304 [Polysphondylium violaceum]